MSLTATEMATLMKLQKKASQPIEPLSDKDLADMEQRVIDVYHQNLDVYKICLEPWNAFCKSLRTISDDNAKLLIEIRRLRAENKEAK